MFHEQRLLHEELNAFDRIAVTDKFGIIRMMVVSFS
jgi:hypothetical protein